MVGTKIPLHGRRERLSFVLLFHYVTNARATTFSSCMLTSSGFQLRSQYAKACLHGSSNINLWKGSDFQYHACSHGDDDFVASAKRSDGSEARSSASSPHCSSVQCG